MFEHLFDSIVGVETFALISLFLFFALFLGIVYWAVKADKKYLKKMKDLPLDNTKNNGESDHE